jgi:hypothetical protein
MFRCLAAVDMKLINGSQIINRYLIGFFANSFDAAADRPDQVAVRD